MHVIIKNFLSYTYFYFRSLIKWFLHKVTRLCEIQRICYGTEKGANRAFALEYSLRHSRSPLIISIIEQLDTVCKNRRLNGESGSALVEIAASGIITAKHINIKIQKCSLCVQLNICLAQIFGYQQLVQEVEFVRSIPYSSEDAQHENKLMTVWSGLMPNEQLHSRISKQWGDIGFQGDDPKTDFRGMGLLGLENLYYFVLNYGGTARHVLSHSNHPSYGYSFAIVGINLTSMAYDFLLNGTLKTHMYNIVEGRPSLKHFHQVYVYLFYEFDKFWLENKPKDVMEFSRIRDLFHKRIRKLLNHPRGSLKLNLSVEVI